MWKTVKRGDTLKSLAKKYGTTDKKIAALNNIDVNTVLKAGGKLKVS